MAEISRSRFEFALTNLRPSDWETFEKLAAAFLVDEFPNIRTMASYSGDGGRDGDLFSPDGIPTVAIQYSLRKDFPEKIRQTVKRIHENFSEVKSIIYLTNQTIGPSADALKHEIRKGGIILDVRDITWFADRANTTANRSAAADDLARIIADPLLSKFNEGRKRGRVFTRQEADTALTFLELQFSDDKRDKGLTKSSFEALVRAALVNTDKTKRLSEGEIVERVCKLLPKHNKQTLEPFTHAAINRLSKSSIAHSSEDDTLYLREEEVSRLNGLVAEIELLNEDFDEDVLAIAAAEEAFDNSTSLILLDTVRTIIGRYFLAKGEEFATAIAKETEIKITQTELASIITQVISTHKKINFVTSGNNIDFLLSLIDNLFRDASAATNDYLKLLSDSYTVFAFLEETPDVQNATSKLFSQSDVWLDTSALLPIFAEIAFPEANRPFTTAYKQASRASMNLYIIPGVLQEIERHLNKCLTFTRSPNWEGRAPYLISQYLLAGKRPDGFKSWMEQFCGDYHPERDIAHYLAEQFGISVVSDQDYLELDQEIIEEVKVYWQSVQDKRRGGEQFSMNAHRLAAHDAETYLTVLNRRRRSHETSSIGHKEWWLTMDSAAWQLMDAVNTGGNQIIRHSPLMSIDFLLKYLAFGPNRARVSQSDVTPAIIFGSSLVEAPKDLLEVARDVRSRSAGMPDRVVQREIRDALDKARERAGALQDGGLANVGKIIGEMF